MIEFREFRNTDTPLLAELWRSQPPQRALVQPMSTAVFERYVLSKPTFDRRGLTVAVEADKIVGFAHAGFGPTEDQRSLSRTAGVTSLVLLRPGTDPAIADQLIARSEAYLASQGATEFYGGGSYPLAPFYYGLYGGGEFSGVLDSDARMQSFFRDRGYVEAARAVVLHRDLAGFRPVIDRTQMQVRRQHTVEMVADPPTTSWWEACTFEPFDRTQCILRGRDGSMSALVNFWSMDTYVGAWGVRAAGVAGLQVLEQKRRQGLATFLLGEALRHLHSLGVTLVEVHIDNQNGAGLSTFAHLAFERVDGSVLYRKP